MRMNRLPLFTAVDNRERNRSEMVPKTNIFPFPASLPSCLLLCAYLEAVEVELEGGGGRDVLEVHVVGLAVLGVGDGHGRLLRVHQHGRVAAQRAMPGRQVQLEGRRDGGKI